MQTNTKPRRVASQIGNGGNCEGIAQAFEALHCGFVFANGRRQGRDCQAAYTMFATSYGLWRRCNPNTASWTWRKTSRDTDVFAPLEKVM